MRQYRHNAKQLCGTPQNRGFSGLLRLGTSERPRVLRREVLVRGSNHAPNRFQGARETQIFVVFEHFANRALNFLRQRFVPRLAFRGFRNLAAEIFLDERGRTAGKIAEAVREVAVIARDQRVVAEIAVLAEYHFAQQKITQRVHAQHVGNRPRQDDVALGLAHFSRVHEEPAVGPHLLRHRLHGGHQKRGPINSVEANDVFADEMQIRRPHAAAFKLRPADRAETGRERVEPNIKDMWLFAGNGDAPANRRARNAEIFEAAFHETYNLVAARLRLDKIRILFVKIEQRLLKRGQLEEIIFLGNGFGGAATIGAVVARLRVIHEGIVVDTVLTCVLPFVDVAVLAAKPEKPLHGSNVPQVGRANELIRGETEFIP